MKIEWRYFLPARRRGKNHVFVDGAYVSLCGHVLDADTLAAVQERAKCKLCDRALASLPIPDDGQVSDAS